MIADVQAELDWLRLEVTALTLPPGCAFVVPRPRREVVSALRRIATRLVAVSKAVEEP